MYFYVFLLVKVVIQIAFYYTETDFSPRGNQSIWTRKTSSLAIKAVLYKATMPQAFVKAIYTLDSIAWSWEGFCHAMLNINVIDGIRILPVGKHPSYIKLSHLRWINKSLATAEKKKGRISFKTDRQIVHFKKLLF